MRRPTWENVREAALLLSLVVAFASNARGVTINWLPVGNPGNGADPATGLGAVGNSYYISEYDVTNGQYADFLNAKDPSGVNSLGLFNNQMRDNNLGGIKFTSGNPTGDKYSAKPGDEYHPVNFVGWYDAIRFANWINNGQGNGDTETGAYTLNGGTAVPTNGATITRNTGATVFLPSESEWYKAAFYEPATNSYFSYATSSNTAPKISLPTGAINSVNYGQVTQVSGFPNGLTTAVGAYSGTTSPYGAFDMAGNVYQWNEALISGQFREYRGGSYDTLAINDPLSSTSFIHYNSPTQEIPELGFRLAALVPVPEPNSLALACFGFLGSIALARRQTVNLLPSVLRCLRP